MSEPEPEQPEPVSEPEPEQPEPVSEPEQSGLEPVSEPEQPGPTPVPDGVLEWVEFDPGFGGAYGLRSAGSGVVRAWLSDDSGDGTVRIVTTVNGTDWSQSELRLPTGIDPNLVNIDDEPWLVVGRDAGWQEAGFPPTPPRVFVSSNEGTTWTEVPVDSRPVIPYSVVNQYLGTVSTALVSGDRLVFSAEILNSLDIQSLLVDRGLISASQSAVIGETTEDSLMVWVYDDPTVVSEQRTFVEPPDDVVEYAFEDLALTSGQRDLIPRSVLTPRERVRIFSGDADGLSPVAEYVGQGVAGVSTPDGFVLQVGQTFFEEGSSPLVSSSDGRDWSVIDEDPSGRVRRRLAGAAADGAVWGWSIGERSRGVVEKLRPDEAPAAVTVLEGLTFDPYDSHMSVGSAGLALTATSSGAFETLFGFDNFGPGTPPHLWLGVMRGSIGKGRYELRFNQPEHGLTLWDSNQNAAVRVMEDALIGAVPEGVRQSGSGDTYSVVFEDSETGDDLVTFTMEDLGLPSAVPGAETWIGWSTDGVDFQWQTAAEAFGIDAASVSVQLAVGNDFVLAYVDRHRWFIAEAPGG